MSRLPPPVAKCLACLATWNVHTVRYLYLFVATIYVLAASAPALQAIVSAAPARPGLSPQLTLFVTNCQLRCLPFGCPSSGGGGGGCPAFCNASLSTYYTKVWPTLPTVCDQTCRAAEASLCAGTTQCAQLCTEQAAALGRQPDATTTMTAITVLSAFGPTFWSTLLLVPLAAADVLDTLVRGGPLLRATEMEIYNNRYSFVDKFIAFLTRPVHLLQSATLAFEAKVLLFDDSDGYGLSIVVVLQLVQAVIVDGLPRLLQLWRRRSRSGQEPHPDDTTKEIGLETKELSAAAAVSASPRLSIPTPASATPMGQSI
ncbi:Aste57867_16072 [Aphanomyces stellatus]|uniref:Aste57867_16072 protein n=1 Tax=Aphanomyces stellatus TaxID=120398 RepID=A0A485L5M9_9STRA|nr:hypothetical protein As57867_016016 [Aphanomyces stellatus]VFT92856.1 Aste57867_16072 [Aphanomyces stellatus]